MKYLRCLIFTFSAVYPSQYEREAPEMNYWQRALDTIASETLVSRLTLVIDFVRFDTSIPTR